MDISDAPAFDLEIAALKRMFSESRDLTADSRKRAETCFDYYDNRQWTSEQIKVLRKRKQPEIWINRIAPAVNGVLGVLEQGQSDPRAFPRTTTDQAQAEIATDSLRYAAENCRWQRTKLAAARDYLIGGTAAVIVEIDAKRDPVTRQIRWNEFFYDPHSRDADFGDARYKGIAKWMYVDDVKASYPDAEITADGLNPTNMALSDEFDEDRPANAWGDTKRNRVLICEMYLLRRGWQRIVFYGGGILEASPSPYFDDDGAPGCPIEAQSAGVDRDNGRYGIVWAMVPVQDEINMRRSKLLNMVNSRQVRISDPSLAPETDLRVIREEAARPDGVLPYGVEPSSTGEMSQGQIALLSESKAELERMGPNPAVLGRQNADASGRAQLVRQQAGLIELTPVLGGIEDLELRVYRQMWTRIRQFWNEERLVRVTDDIGAAKFMTINEPVMQMMDAIVANPQTGQPERVQQQVQVGVNNRPAEMDMDIIIDSAPDTVNLQAEQFTEIVKLAQIYGPQEVPFEDILEASSLPKKRQLIEKREARKQEAMQAQQAGAGPQQQMQQAGFEAEMAVKQARAAKDSAQADKIKLESQLAAYQAGATVGMETAAG